MPCLGLSLSLRSERPANPFAFSTADHTIRREAKDVRQGVQLRGPVRRVHIDQSYSASEQRVSHHLPDEASELLKKRFQIINVSPRILPASTRHTPGALLSED